MLNLHLVKADDHQLFVKFLKQQEHFHLMSSCPALNFMYMLLFCGLLLTLRFYDLVICLDTRWGGVAVIIFPQDHIILLTICYFYPSWFDVLMFWVLELMSDLPEQWIAFEENLGHWNSGLICQGDTWLLKTILSFANGYGASASDLFKPSSVTIVSIMSYHKRCISLPYFIFE